MTNETTQQGASGYDANPPKERAFPQSGAKPLDKDGEAGDNDEQHVSERDTILEDIEAKIEAQRMAEMAGVVEDPAPAQDDDEDPPPVEGQEEDLRDEGLLSKDEMPADKEDDVDNNNGHLPEEYRDDPLADYIVMDEANNTPMFVTKVNGKEAYIPLDRARQQLQKHEAAEVRMKNAAEKEKELNEREQQILASEQALKAKHVEPLQSPPSTPPAQDVSDQDLSDEAQSVVQSLFNGSEEDAVTKLAEVLGKVRGAATQQTIDQDEIARRAAAQVRREEAVAAAEKDATDGLAKFNETYPDIAADDTLFRYADAMTDTIAAEWKEAGRAFRTSELMMEAGVRTTAWVQSMKTPEPRKTDTKTDRLNRKRNLRPMPTSQSQAAGTHADEEPEQTPYDAVAEMRKARGQA